MFNDLKGYLFVYSGSVCLLQKFAVLEYVCLKIPVWEMTFGDINVKCIFRDSHTR